MRYQEPHARKVTGDYRAELNPRQAIETNRPADRHQEARIAGIAVGGESAGEKPLQIARRIVVVQSVIGDVAKRIY